MHSRLTAEATHKLNALNQDIHQHENQLQPLQIKLTKYQARYADATKELDYEKKENITLRTSIFRDTHELERTQRELRLKLQSSIFIRFFHFFGIRWGITRRLHGLANALSNQLQWDGWQYAENQRRIDAQELHVNHLNETIVNITQTLNQVKADIQSLKNQRHQLKTDPENQLSTELTTDLPGITVTKTEVHTSGWHLFSSAYQYTASFVSSTLSRSDGVTEPRQCVTTEAKTYSAR